MSSNPSIRRTLIPGETHFRPEKKENTIRPILKNNLERVESTDFPNRFKKNTQKDDSENPEGRREGKITLRSGIIQSRVTRRFYESIYRVGLWGGHYRDFPWEGAIRVHYKSGMLRVVFDECSFPKW